MRTFCKIKSSFEPAKVKVINEDTLANAIVLTIIDMGKQRFLEQHLNQFRESIQKILELDNVSNVLILDLVEQKSNLEVTIAARYDKGMYQFVVQRSSRKVSILQIFNCLHHQ